MSKCNRKPLKGFLYFFSFYIRQCTEFVTRFERGACFKVKECYDLIYIYILRSSLLSEEWIRRTRN